MKIYSVNTLSQHTPVRKLSAQNGLTNNNPNLTRTNNQQISFKSDKGALKGIAAGALVGLGAAALIVATGGLAAAVAAVGATGVAGAGAGLGAQVGGIIGGLASGKEDDKG